MLWVGRGHYSFCDEKGVGTSQGWPASYSWYFASIKPCFGTPQALKVSQIF